MTPSDGLAASLKKQHYPPVVLVNPGVDATVFYPANVPKHNPKPIALCVSRICLQQKNLKAFFELKIPHRKIMVGDGPDLQWCKNRFLDVEFKGLIEHKALADIYRQADVFVFPSLHDTFGMVMIEALACALPVAAFNADGVKDIIIDGVNGFKGPCLKTCIEQCKSLERKKVWQSSQPYSWENTAKQLLKCMQKAPIKKSASNVTELKK